MGKVIGGAQRENPQGALSGQPGCVGRGKYFVDGPVPPPRHDAIDFSLTGLGSGFSRQSCGVPRLPGDPHLHSVAVCAQCVNSGPQASIVGRLAVQNNANPCQGFRPSPAEPNKLLSVKPTIKRDSSSVLIAPAIVVS